jgi:long-chain acyl-CoA synthetase
VTTLAATRRMSHGEQLGTLAGLSMGGAPIPPELVSRVDATFASAVAPSNGYGLTETTSAVVSNIGPTT